MQRYTAHWEKIKCTIVKSTLSDGSKVFDVHLDQNGNKIVFHATGPGEALNISEGLAELVKDNTADEIH